MLWNTDAQKRSPKSEISLNPKVKRLNAPRAINTAAVNNENLVKDSVVPTSRPAVIKPQDDEAYQAVLQWLNSEEADFFIDKFVYDGIIVITPLRGALYIPYSTLKG